jgi:hypothetical protein
MAGLRVGKRSRGRSQSYNDSRLSKGTSLRQVQPEGWVRLRVEPGLNFDTDHSLTFNAGARTQSLQPI